jgi:lipopolysaccharide transport system permease protein
VTALGTLKHLVLHWPFACAMAARDLKGSTRGAVLGVAWLVLRPFIQLVAYVAVVSYVFGARMGPEAGPLDYTRYVLSGMIAWQLLQRTLEEAPSLVRDRMEILKQVIYPIETLPLSLLLASLLGPAVALGIFLILSAASGELHWGLLLLPVAIALLVILVLGLSWIMMITGVVLKDLREIVAVVFGLMIYFSPVLLAEAMVGRDLWRLVLLNPFAHVVISFRDVLLGQFHPLSWGVFAALSGLSLFLGAWVVSRAKVLINEYI